jgi:hypothetical protein
MGGIQNLRFGLTVCVMVRACSHSTEHDDRVAFVLAGRPRLVLASWALLAAPSCLALCLCWCLAATLPPQTGDPTYSAVANSSLTLHVCFAAKSMPGFLSQTFKK